MRILLVISTLLCLAAAWATVVTEDHLFWIADALAVGVIATAVVPGFRAESRRLERVWAGVLIGLALALAVMATFMGTPAAS